MPTSRRLLMHSLALPDELILEIGSYLVERREEDHAVFSVSSLASLSRVSRRMRNAVLSQLFKWIPIAQECQLHAIQSLPSALLQHARYVVFVQLVCECSRS